MTEDEARGTTGGWRWPLGPIRILIIATAVLSVVFLIIPQIDLWFSRQFYDAETGFPAARIPALQWLRDVSGIILWVVGGVIGLSLLAKLLLFPRRPPVVPGRAMLFLSATLALSAGLLVNGILKSLWGRPRPTQVLEFGGDAPFITAWHISDYCARNCSFVSGEASAAIWLVAVALVVPARFRRAALATALALAFAFSLNRVAFGGHFLSDVLLSWTLTLLIIAVAWHFLYVRPPRFLEESAIDGALTRAGLWLRGLVARRRKDEAPLHPEAVAVLTGVAEIPAHAAHAAPAAPQPGLRPAGRGFAGAAADDIAEPPEHDRDPHALWPEDAAHTTEARDDDVLPEDAAAPAVMFPPKGGMAPPDRDDDETAAEEVAMAGLASEFPDARAESIESIDPEPDDAPPPFTPPPAAVVSAADSPTDPSADAPATPSPTDDPGHLDLTAALDLADEPPHGAIPLPTAPSATEASPEAVPAPPALDHEDAPSVAVVDASPSVDAHRPAEDDAHPAAADEAAPPPRLLELPPPDRS